MSLRKIPILGPLLSPGGGDDKNRAAEVRLPPAPAPSAPPPVPQAAPPSAEPKLAAEQITADAERAAGEAAAAARRKRGRRASIFTSAQGAAQSALNVRKTVLGG